MSYVSRRNGERAFFECRTGSCLLDQAEAAIRNWSHSEALGGI